MLRRRPTKRTLGALAGCLALLIALGYVFFLSPWLRFTTPRIVGGDRFGQSQLKPLIADDLGRPMAAISLDDLQGRVGADPRVAAVQVVRAWPHTIEFRVSERVPVLAVPTSAQGAPGSKATSYRLLAGDGKTVEQVSAPPTGIAEADAATARAGTGALSAAAEVVAALPAPLRGKVTGVSAATRDSVIVTMTVPAVASIKVDAHGKVTLDQPKAGKDGKIPEREVTVVWGGVEQSALKAEVLVSMLTTDAKVYDVSSPSTPVTRDSALPKPAPVTDSNADPNPDPNSTVGTGAAGASASPSQSPTTAPTGSGDNGSSASTSQPTLGSAVQVP